MDKFILILTTTNNFDEAKKIAGHLLEMKLIACANIISGVTSVYSWKDEICEDSEFVILMKSRKNVFDEVKKEIQNLHSYEVPEIISVNIENLSEKYLSWLDDVIKK